LPMDGSHSLLIRSDSSLALRCRKGAIHPIMCEICKQGRVTKRMEELAFRQWSDKGYINDLNRSGGGQSPSAFLS
jgi:hypothetical protein